MRPRDYSLTGPDGHRAEVEGVGVKPNTGSWSWPTRMAPSMRRSSMDRTMVVSRDRS